MMLDGPAGGRYSGRGVALPHTIGHLIRDSALVGGSLVGAREEVEVRLIDDAPAEEDAFAPEGGIGPHGRVAKAIADLITSRHDDGGKMIGLEGGWGSGKTTVVNLMCKRLQGNEDLRVFRFDAWAHQDDPLRRTFLESLISHFMENGWIEERRKKYWKNTVDELAKRRKVSKALIVPKSSKWGKRVGLAALLVPFGCVLASAGAQQGLTIRWGLPVNLLFIAGVLLALSPVVTVVIWRLCGGGEPLLLGDSVTELETKTSETPDPTSIEFETHFDKLLNEVLSEHPSRKTVFVLDNLDRIEPDDARQMWSTLQTFLQFSRRASERWLKRLWVVVPYDPKGLRALWTAPSEDEGTSASKEDIAVSQSFIDKSFQIRFEVPSPVLSDWHEYLLRTARAAFLSMEERGLQTIRRVFGLHRHEANRADEPPTPREIKIYVNQIGSVLRQWRHDFTIGAIAYYVLLRRDGKDLPSLLLSTDKQIPSSRMGELIGQSPRAQLAGLAFNVPPEKGEHILLTEPILDALRRQNIQWLLTKEERYPDGFWTVVESVLNLRVDADDSDLVANSAVVLGGGKFKNKQRLGRAQSAVCRIARNVANWAPLHHVRAEGIAVLCEMAKDLAYSEEIVSVLRTSLEKPQEGGEPVEPAKLIDNIVLILSLLRRLGHDSAYSQGLQLPVDANGWVAACARLHDKHKWRELAPSLSPAVEAGQIVISLAEAVSTDAFQQNHLHTISVSAETPLEFDWGPLVKSLAQKLEAAAATPIERVELLVKALCYLQAMGDRPAAAALKGLADKGHMLHHLVAADAKKLVKCQALLVFAFLAQRPSAEKPAVAGDSEAGYQKLTTLLGTKAGGWPKQLVTLLKKYEAYGLLFDVVKARGHYDPFITACLERVADSETPEDVFTTDVFLEHWQELKTELQTDADGAPRFDVVVGKLLQRTELRKQIPEKHKDFQPDHAGLYDAVLRVDEDGDEAFQAWIADGLRGLDKDRWAKELRQAGTITQLASRLREIGFDFHLDQPYQDAVEEYAKEVMAGSQQITGTADHWWPNLLDALAEGPSRQEMRRTLIEAACGRDGKIGEAFFRVFGSEIGHPPLLARTNRLVTRLFHPILKSQDPAGLKWLRNVIATQSSLVGPKVEGREAFAERVQRSLRDDRVPEQAISEIRGIAELLGIEADTQEEQRQGADDEPRTTNGSGGAGEAHEGEAAEERPSAE